MWYIILIFIAALYVIIHLVIPSMFTGFLGANIIKPLLWISLATLVFLTARYEGLNIWRSKKIRRWDIGKNPFQAALLIGGFQISLLILLGLFSGFGESPYSHSPLGIIMNLFFIVALLLGMELSRSYLIKKATTFIPSHITMIMGAVAILFMIVQVSPSNFSLLGFQEPASSLKFIGESIIPVLAMSLFATYLAYLGGALPALGYMGIMQGFEWFSPILPDLDWAPTALVGTIAPAIGFLIIQNSISDAQHRVRKTRRKQHIVDPAVSWTGVAVISVMFIFFTFGYFPIQPTVISSGSMQPSIDVGDVVIIQHIPSEKIQEGDVIQFLRPNTTTPLVHRVHEIYEEKNTKIFITKGDANDKPDTDPVVPQQILGKAIVTIPKIGWVPITIKSLIQNLGSAI